MGAPPYHGMEHRLYPCIAACILHVGLQQYLAFPSFSLPVFKQEGNVFYHIHQFSIGLVKCLFCQKPLSTSGVLDCQITTGMWRCRFVYLPVTTSCLRDSVFLFPRYVVALVGNKYYKPVERIG